MVQNLPYKILYWVILRFPITKETITCRTQYLQTSQTNLSAVYNHFYESHDNEQGISVGEPICPVKVSLEMNSHIWVFQANNRCLFLLGHVFTLNDMLPFGQPSSLGWTLYRHHLVKFYFRKALL